MESNISLVTGGARSGKSVFAEELLACAAGPKAYIATARIEDDEMARRIAWHRKRRPASWQTLEAPSGLASVLSKALTRADAVLIDCLTIYFSNYLLSHLDTTFEGLVDGAMAELDDILDAARRYPQKTVIFVTNELGSGIVPMEQLSRDYRDLLGLVNQRVAREAGQVYLTVCGIATEIKSRQVTLAPCKAEQS